MDDSPIIGANITIKGDKNTGTISDIDGNFSLSIPDNKTILVVTYIGYKTREVPVEDLGNIKIVLEGDDHTLNEVVVVGSGTQKKVSVTGAITSIKGASLKLPSSTLSNSFAGKLAGVNCSGCTGNLTASPGRNHCSLCSVSPYFNSFPRVSRSLSTSIGLERWAFMPLARDLRISSSKALALMAMIGIFL